jgi:RNA polymerase sigma factor (sigma-70 family)
VLRTVALTLGDRHRAEEVTQEAFARAYRRWRSVRTMDRPDAWVIVVAVNAERRRWRRDEGADLVEDVEDTHTGDHASGVVARVAVSKALANLTARQRAVVVLRYLADLPFSEVAEALGCAEGTARATLHQALARMRIDLADGEA